MVEMDREQFFKAWHESLLNDMEMQGEYAKYIHDAMRLQAEAIWNIYLEVNSLRNEVKELQKFIKTWMPAYFNYHPPVGVETWRKDKYTEYSLEEDIK
jgi:hypothetical protein